MVESACHKKHAAAPVPYTPPPATPPPAAKPATTTPAQLEQPPAIPPAPTPAPPPVPSDTTHYQVNKPPQPKKSKKASAAPAGTAPAATTPAPAQAAPATPPRLGDILTPDQQREYNAAIDQSLSRAQTSLGSIGNRQLSRDQQTLVDQIRSFMQQALEARKTDLQGAKRLAERADVLAGDLAASFR